MTKNFVSICFYDYQWFFKTFGYCFQTKPYWLQVMEEGRSMRKKVYLNQSSLFKLTQTSWLFSERIHHCRKTWDGLQAVQLSHGNVLRRGIRRNHERWNFKVSVCYCWNFHVWATIVTKLDYFFTSGRPFDMNNMMNPTGKELDYKNSAVLALIMENTPPNT